MVVSPQYVKSIDDKIEQKKREIRLADLEVIVDKLILEPLEHLSNGTRKIPLAFLKIRNEKDIEEMENELFEKYRKEGWEIKNYFHGMEYSHVKIGYLFSPRREK